MSGGVITLGAIALAVASWLVASAVLALWEFSILDPLLPLGAVFVVLSLAEKALGRWGRGTTERKTPRRLTGAGGACNVFRFGRR